MRLPFAIKDRVYGIAGEFEERIDSFLRNELGLTPILDYGRERELFKFYMDEHGDIIVLKIKRSERPLILDLRVSGEKVRCKLFGYLVEPEIYTSDDCSLNKLDLRVLFSYFKSSFEEEVKKIIKEREEEIIRLYEEKKAIRSSYIV